MVPVENNRMINPPSDSDQMEKRLNLLEKSSVNPSIINSIAKLDGIKNDLAKNSILFSLEQPDEF